MRGGGGAASRVPRGEPDPGGAARSLLHVMLRVPLHRSSTEDGLLVVRSMEGLVVRARQPAGSVRPTRCASQGVVSSAMHRFHPATRFKHGDCEDPMQGSESGQHLAVIR